MSQDPTTPHASLLEQAQSIVRRLVDEEVTEPHRKISPLRPHDLRHTFATHKAERGVSPWRLQEWLGHAHINTTQIYVHIGKQNARRQMEATSL